MPESSMLFQLIERFGLPLIGLVVLGWAFVKVVRIAFEYFKQKDAEGTQRAEKLTVEIKEVRDKHEETLTTIVKDSIKSQDRLADAAERMIESDEQTRTVLLSTQSTLDSSRRVLEEFKREFGSSDRLNAVRDARRG